ncbi:head-to-tail adaptor [Streptomyces phage Verse]|uniref:Head-to-tail adaptor n=2 Tax=Streptomyces phage Amela TaxID=1673877 RepID=A0A0K1Y9J1_9CAUD|nr:head-tail adaptor Ad1 [Streptomyces phage Amela]AKY03766.1 head-to-tail adaptor [Streptomyces phage Amela]AKY03841.1 head-to-tail adaptor [Streptomyces phage Verse]
MAYATLDDLKARLDWELDADEVRIAGGALEDATDLAAHYGRDWDDTAVPRLVRTLVLKAASRYMKNPDGYTQSRAGDETLGWNDAAGENAGTVYFSDEEIKLLQSLAGKTPGIYSVPLTAYKTKLRSDADGRVPVDYGGDPFPMFADGAGAV